MSDLLNRVIDAVLSCREIMLSPFTVYQKDGISNIVTTADRAVEEHLREALLNILPDAAFLGEEGDNTDGQIYRFVVDPIDGTANFARGMNASAVSVGITKNGEGYLGVVYNPFTDELYYAQAGEGAFFNGTPIHVSDRDFAHSLYYTAFSLYRKEFADTCMNILRDVYAECDDFRREGSAALELCRLAAGKAELYFEIRIFSWDSCAAEVILREAGGISRHLYSESFGIAHPFPLIAANNNENLNKLFEIVKRELPTLPENYS